MGTNGFQEPATGFENGRIVGTDRLYTDGKFSTDDGKARFMKTAWRGLQAPGKAEEQAKFPFLINNGRANHVWQSAYLDKQNPFVMDRYPYPFIEMHPDDMAGLGVGEGDLVEIFNDNGSTQAMAYPTPTARPGETFMLFAYPTGPQGNVTSAGVNELIIPNYKQTWGNLRKLAARPTWFATSPSNRRNTAFSERGDGRAEEAGRHRQNRRIRQRGTTMVAKPLLLAVALLCGSAPAQAACIDELNKLQARFDETFGEAPPGTEATTVQPFRPGARSCSHR
jgi:predicted molibdopterin-dependent oxidoreductase YjgC